MERRDFLKTSVLATGALASSSVFAAEQKTKKFAIDMAYNADFKSAKDIKLYTPLPMLSASQKISQFKIGGNFTSHKILSVTDSPLLFTQYNQTESTNKNLNISFVLELTPYQKEQYKGREYTNFLKQTRYVRTDGQIAEIANFAKSLPVNKKIDFFKYYITSNIAPEQRVFSDAINSIRDKKNNLILSGENISANSVLVALCRASNIPAREVFGFDISHNRLVSNNKAEILLDHYWERIDINHSHSYDFVALNSLRDDYVGDIYTSSIHQTLGSIDGNNLKYYKDFSEKINLYQIS